MFKQNKAYCNLPPSWYFCQKHGLNCLLTNESVEYFTHLGNSTWAFFFSLWIRRDARWEILFHHETSEWFHELENVAAAWIHEVVSRRRVKYQFWMNYPFLLNVSQPFESPVAFFFFFFKSHTWQAYKSPVWFRFFKLISWGFSLS